MIATDLAAGVHLLYNVRPNPANQVLYAKRPADAPWSPAVSVEFAAWSGNGPIDLAVSPSGVAHCVYTTGDFVKTLRYGQVSAQGVVSQKATVFAGPPTDTGPVVQASLAVDQTGKAHVAYSSRPEASFGDWSLYYASQVNDTWTSSAVNVPRGSYPSIAVDSAGTIHIVFASGSGNARGLSHAFRTPPANDWTIEVIDAAGSSGTIALGPDGVPHVLYSNASATMHAARGSGGGWTSEPAPSRSGGFVITAEGTLHALQLVAGQATYFRKPVGGTWSSGSALGAAVWLGSGRSLAVDSTGVVHAVFMADTTAKIHVTGCPAP